MNVKFVGILSRLMLVAFLATGTLACGDMDEEENQNQVDPGDGDAAGDGDGDGEESIAVEGTWTTNFGGEESIDDEVWGFMLLIDFDNDERWAIAQNPSDSEYNPDEYNRLVWTPIEDDVFHYCTVAFGLETEEEARNAENTADDQDLDGEGCGGFSWTEMTRQ